jgi:hypothetical protein
MINQQLIDYIKQKLEEGVGKKALKDTLITKGWSEQEINEAINIYDNATNATVSVSKPKIRSSVLITILVLFVVIAGGTIYAYKFFYKTDNSTTETSLQKTNNQTKLIDSSSPGNQVFCVHPGPELPELYTNIDYPEDYNKDIGWFAVTTPENEKSMVEGEIIWAFTNDRWNTDFDPQLFFEYYNKYLGDNGWQKVEYQNTKEIEKYGYEKDGRYIYFGITKRENLNIIDNIGFQYSYCYPDPRPEISLQINTQTPDKIDRIDIFVEKSIGFDAFEGYNEGKLFKSQNWTGQSSKAISLPSGVYTVRLVPNTTSYKGSEESLNLTQDTVISLHASMPIY